MELPSLCGGILVIYLQLYLGRATPSSLQCRPRVGARHSSRDERRVVGTFMGHNDQWHHDGKLGLEETSHRPRAKVHRIVPSILWPRYI